jgi:hypothetical protein
MKARKFKWQYFLKKKKDNIKFIEKRKAKYELELMVSKNLPRTGAGCCAQFSSPRYSKVLGN